MSWIADNFDQSLCNFLTPYQICLHEHRNEMDKSCSNFQRRVVEMRLIGFQLEQIKNGYNRKKELNNLKKSTEYVKFCFNYSLLH